MFLIEEKFDVLSYFQIFDIDDLYHNVGLNFSGTNINNEDLSFLLKCPNLRYLFLNNTSISDISILSKLTYLMGLEINNTMISKVDSVELQNILNNTSIFFNGI